MNESIKYSIYSLVGLLLFIFFVIIFMAIFRLCPPIESGPQPPWCLNEERFERDFTSTSLISYFRASLYQKIPGKVYDTSVYDSSKDNVNYFPKPQKMNNFSMMFGVAHNDFSWPVCRSFRECIVPEKGIESTLRRIKSIGGDFIFITDYAHNNLKKEIYDNKIGVSNRFKNKLLINSQENNLKTMVVTNLFIDDKVTRHTEIDKEYESISRREGSSVMASSVDYWEPDEKNMNLLFDNWEKMILNKANKWKDVDYFIVNPEDTSFMFLTHFELQNNRNKQLLNKVREVYDGKICFIVNQLSYLEKYNQLDFYKDADCIILEGHFDYKNHNVGNNLNSLEFFFDEYFSNSFFEKNEKLEIFIMMSAMSYDEYLDDSWFEGWDYEYYNLDYDTDFKLQATIYQAFFRSIQKNQPNIKGIIHYGYWWEDVNFEDYFIKVDLINSIRNKDAEHIFYRWSNILK